MNLKNALLTIGSITSALGLGNLVDLSALLGHAITALGLPAWLATAPAVIKYPVVLGAVLWALYSAFVTSQHNPDGTPATEAYKPE